jgi:hypothetical protein
VGKQSVRTPGEEMRRERGRVDGRGLEANGRLNCTVYSADALRMSN